MSSGRDLAKKILQLPGGIVMRMGEVTAYSAGPPRTVTATVGGVSLSGIPITDQIMETVVGDSVWILDSGDGKMLGMCSVGYDPSRLRLTATDDVTLSSTLHAFQIGPSTGPNMAVDQNEIQSRNNGAVNTLYLNHEGGEVYINGVAAGKTNWFSLSFSTAWQNYGGGFNLCRYRRNGDQVELEGLALYWDSMGTSASPGYQNVIGVLPVGYRPSLVSLHPALAGVSGAPARVLDLRVDTAGQVLIDLSYTVHEHGMYVSLNGITFTITV